MRSKSAALLLILILSVLHFGFVGPAPAQGTNPARSADAAAESIGGLPDPPVKWKAKLPSLGYPTHGGQVVPAIVVRGSVVYVPGGNTLTALDVPTGRELWTSDPGIGLSLTRVEAGNNAIILVFAFTGDLVPIGGIPPAYVIAVDPRSGSERWSYSSHESWISACVVVEDNVYLAASSGSISRLSTATGEVNWSTPSPSGDYIADVASNGGILYLLGSRVDQDQNELYSVYAVDVASKQLRWSIQAPGIDDVGIGFPSLRVTGDVLYITGLHSLYVLERATGKLRWRYEPGSHDQSESQLYPAIRTMPVIAGDMVYLGVAMGSATQADCYDSRESYLLGLETETGKERWRFRTENDIDIGESLAVYGGNLYYAGSAVCGSAYNLYSYLYAVDLRSHSIVWRLYAGAESFIVPPLVITHGTLFVGSVSTSRYVDYDLFYVISAAPVGMPKTGSAGVSLWPVVLVGIFSIVCGTISRRLDRFYARKDIPH